MVLAGRMNLSPAASVVGVQALAISGVLVPVLSLALIPYNFKEPGIAFGVLDSAKSLAQALLVLALGEMRELGGYSMAMVFASTLFALVGLLVLIIIRDLRDETISPTVEKHAENTSSLSSSPYTRAVVIDEYEDSLL